MLFKLGVFIMEYGIYAVIIKQNFNIRLKLTQTIECFPSFSGIADEDWLLSPHSARNGVQVGSSWLLTHYIVHILGYPGVIPLATSTPGTISWISFNLRQNEYYHFIGFILVFGRARWPMKTIYLRERLSDWTAQWHTITLRIDFWQQIQSFSR